MIRNDKLETMISFLFSIIIHIIIILLIPGIKQQINIEGVPEKLEVIQANFIKIKYNSKNVVITEKSKETTNINKQIETGKNNSAELPVPAKLSNKPIANNLIVLPSLNMPVVSTKNSSDYIIPLPNKNEITKGESDYGARVKDKDLISDIKINETGRDVGKEENIPIKLDLDSVKESDKISIKNYNVNIDGGISDNNENINKGTKKDIQLVSGDGTLGTIVAVDPVYPEIAKKNGWYGEVILIILVRENATVEEVFIEQKSGYPVLDDAAKKAAYKWRIPIIKNGMQISGKVRAKINFVLK